MGLPITEAISTYALLTVGDGLVSQIPALLVSIAAGLIVTRSTGNADLGSDVFAQFSHQGSAVRSAGIMIMLMGVIPGLPRIPFLMIGGGLALVGQPPGRAAGRSLHRSPRSRRSRSHRHRRSRWPTMHASSHSSSTSAST